MAVARARLVSPDRAIGPARRVRIPFPGVLLGNPAQIGLRLLHAAEQNSAVAFAVPDQRRVVARTGRVGGLKLGPFAGQGIPLPGVAIRDRHAGLVVGASRAPLGNTASEEQHVAGGLLEHHAMLAARAGPDVRVGALDESVAKIPVPDVGVVADRGRAPSEDNQLVAERVEDHARACTTVRLVAGRSRAAVGP